MLRNFIIVDKPFLNKSYSLFNNNCYEKSTITTMWVLSSQSCAWNDQCACPFFIFHAGLTIFIKFKTMIFNDFHNKFYISLNIAHFDMFLNMSSFFSIKKTTPIAPFFRMVFAYYHPVFATHFCVWTICLHVPFLHCH